MDVRFAEDDILLQLDCLVSILKCLASSPKCVEDDTCYGRILHSLDVVIKENDPAVAGYIKTAPESVFDLCIKVFNSPVSHLTSKSFATKLFGLLSSYDGIISNLSSAQHDTWIDGSNVLIKFIVDEAETTFVFSWLQALHCLVSSKLGMKVAINGFLFEKIFPLAMSPFLFVKKEAIGLLSTSLCCLCNMVAEKQISVKGPPEVLKDFIQLMLSSPLEVNLMVLTKCLRCHMKSIVCMDPNHLVTMKSKLQNDFKSEMMKLAQTNDGVLVNFLITLTSERYFEQLPLLDKEHVIDLGIGALTNNPTKKLGYLVLCNMSKYDDFWKNSLPRLVEATIERSLDLHLTTTSCDNLDFLLCVEKTTSSKHLYTDVLSNCIQTWTQMCLDQIFDVQVHRGIECFCAILASAYGVEETEMKFVNRSSHLYQNPRIGLCLLTHLERYVAAFVTNGKCIACTDTILQSTLNNLFESPAADHKVISKAGSMILKCLTGTSLCLIHKNVLDESLHELLEKVNIKTSSRIWEIRDSAFELINECLQTDNDEVLLLMRNVCNKLDIFTTVAQGLCDDNSFVRSSAIKAAEKVNNFVNPKKLEELLKKICEILQDDFEAFARRTAVNAFASIVCSNEKYQHDFISCVNNNHKHASITGNHLLNGLLWNTFHKYVLVDLDWEVRLNAVSFIEILFEKTKEQDKSIGNAFCCLLKPFLACGDHAVEEKACQLFLAISADLPQSGEVNFVTGKKHFHLVELQNLLNDVLFLVSDKTSLDQIAVGSDISSNALDCY